MAVPGGVSGSAGCLCSLHVGGGGIAAVSPGQAPSPGQRQGEGC